LGALAAGAYAAAAVGILAIGCAFTSSRHAIRRRATDVAIALLVWRALAGEVATLHARAGTAVQLGIFDLAGGIDAALTADVAAAELAGGAVGVNAAFVGTRGTLAAAPAAPLPAEAGATRGAESFGIAGPAIGSTVLRVRLRDHEGTHADRGEQG